MFLITLVLITGLHRISAASAPAPANSSCIYDFIDEATKIDSSCLEVWVRNNVKISTVVPDFHAFDGIVAAKSVELAGCQNISLLPKLRRLRPSGNGPALVVKNCHAHSPDSFKELKEIVLDHSLKSHSILDRCRSIGSFQLGLALEPYFWYRAYLSKDTIIHNKLFLHTIFPNVSISDGVQLVFDHNVYKAFVSFFYICASISLVLVVVIVVPKLVMGACFGRKEAIRTTEIITTVHNIQWRFTWNLRCTNTRLIEYQYLHDYRALRFLASCKFVGWMGNAQESEDVMMQRKLNTLITDVSYDAIDEIEDRFVRTDTLRTQARKLRRAIGEIHNGLEDAFHATLEMRKDARNAVIYIRNVENAKKEENVPQPDDRQPAGGGYVPSRKLRATEVRAKKIIDKPISAEELQMVTVKAMPQSTFGSLANILKDDEEDLEEGGCLAAKVLVLHGALDIRARRSAIEDTKITQRRISRETATKEYYAEVFRTLKMRGVPIDESLVPPIAWQQKKDRLLADIFSDLGWSNDCNWRLDEPVELSLDLEFGDGCVGFERLPNESGEAFTKRIEEHGRKEREDFEMACLAADLLPGNKAVDESEREAKEAEEVLQLKSKFVSEYGKGVGTKPAATSTNGAPATPKMDDQKPEKP